MLKKTYILPIIFVTSICFGIYTYASAAGYIPLTPLPGLTSGIPTNTNAGASGSGFSAYLRILYVWGVAAASGLAVIMIMWGGVEYMTSAGGGGVEEAKKRISSAVLGLILALGSYIILYTINRNMLRLDFGIGQINVGVSKNQGVKYVGAVNNYNSSAGAQQVDSEGYLVDAYGERIVNENNEMIYVGLNNYSYISSLPSGNGNVTLTSYGYAGDLTPDTNSSQARGNHNNLLVSGSVALSPDVISRLQPSYGAAVYVGDTKIGYYDDSTAASYDGRQLTNRVDIFDPTGSLGGNDFSKKLSGEIRIDNNDIRSSAYNPSR